MKITVTNEKQSRHIQGEFTAAIHGHYYAHKTSHSSNRFTLRRPDMAMSFAKDNNNNEKRQLFIKVIIIN